MTASAYFTHAYKDRIPSTAPIIPSLPPDTKRPLWSVMIPVYNCARFIPDTLHSVLSQAPDVAQMQIEVVDDGSTDADVEALVRTIGKGRVTYFRQPANVGSLRNFETCLNRAKGKLIHLLHGDDRVINGFYTKIEELFHQYPESGAAFCNYHFINEVNKRIQTNPIEMKREGVLRNWLIRLAERQRIQYVAMVVRREVYEELGSFYGTTYGEDWEMWVRIARYYPMAYTPAVLAEYRGHTGSLTWDKAISGKIFQDLLHTMDLIKEHLPPKSRSKTMDKARKHCAHYLIGIANSIWKSTHHWPSTLAQIKQALVFSRSLSVMKRIAKLYVKVAISRVTEFLKSVFLEIKCLFSKNSILP